MNKLAEQLHVPADEITRRSPQRRGQTALRLARYFGNFPNFWLGMHKDYDLQVVRGEFEAEVEREDLPNNKS